MQSSMKLLNLSGKWLLASNKPTLRLGKKNNLQELILNNGLLLLYLPFLWSVVRMGELKTSETWHMSLIFLSSYSSRKGQCLMRDKDSNSPSPNQTREEIRNCFFSLNFGFMYILKDSELSWWLSIWQFSDRDIFVWLMLLQQRKELCQWRTEKLTGKLKMIMTATSLI